MTKKIKKILNDSCILFTFFVFILLIINNLISAPAAGIVLGLSLQTAALLFCCSVLLRTFHGILNIQKIKLWLRVLINYILVVGTGFITLKLVGTLTNHSSNGLVSFLLLSVFALSYSGFVVGYMIIKKKHEEKKKEKEEYKSIVKK